MSKIADFQLYVRGEIPKALSGSLIIAASRRNKKRDFFFRWHDSQADIIKMDISPGKPGKIRVKVLEVDPWATDLSKKLLSTEFDKKSFKSSKEYGYVTQPNHGINVQHDKLWVTNLLFGAPLEIDLKSFRSKRVLRYVDVDETAPRVTNTSHFAWSLDRTCCYFHQSVLRKEGQENCVRADTLKLVELEVASDQEKIWDLLPPDDDADLESANFHSAFYFEENGKKFVGLLKTGAIVESIAPHEHVQNHFVKRMPVSSIWIVHIDNDLKQLKAQTLPGIKQLGDIALSHLDVDNSSANGFILYANYKTSDVAEETHGENVYDENPGEVYEHYSGMIVEALNYGQVIRYEWQNNNYTLNSFRRPYDDGNNSLGHSWLPINIELDESKKYLYCSFNGFRPRLLSKHIYESYKDIAVDPQKIRYVPPLLMRFDAKTLKPDYDKKRTYLSYAEPMAMCVIGETESGYVCTFSPELGLRIYNAKDFTNMVCHAVSAELWTWSESHFRPDPAHMVFIQS